MRDIFMKDLGKTIEPGSTFATPICKPIFLVDYFLTGCHINLTKDEIVLVCSIIVSLWIILCKMVMVSGKRHYCSVFKYIFRAL